MNLMGGNQVPAIILHNLVMIYANLYKRRQAASGVCTRRQVIREEAIRERRGEEMLQEERRG